MSDKKDNNSPKMVKTGDDAMINLVPSKPMCVESFADIPPLGRFDVKDTTKTKEQDNVIGEIKPVKRINVSGIIKSVDKSDGDGRKVTKSAQKAATK